MDVNSWINDNHLPEMSIPECDNQAEAILSEGFQQQCDLETSAPVNMPIKPIHCSQLCENKLKMYFPGGIASYEKVDSPGFRPWINYSPDQIHPRDRSIKGIKYTDIVKANIDVVADFCDAKSSDGKCLSDTMRACLKRPRFRSLMECFPMEFGSKGFKESFIRACDSTEHKLTSDLGQDTQRNVSVMFCKVMQQLTNCSLIRSNNFKDWCVESDSWKSEVLNDAANHATAMTRLFVKLCCIDKAEASSEDDRHEVWRSIVTEIARYAGVLYSLNGETRRYYFSRDKERIVHSEADLEIMMSACMEGYEYATVPRITVQVCEERPDATTEEAVLVPDDNPQASGHLDTALPDSILKEKATTEIAWIKKKLFGQHAAQLMTVQQSLEYCMPGFPDINKGKPVIGLFVQNQKLFFTKLTGSEQTGRKFTVSNWCLQMDKFADRVLLMVFLCAYCRKDYNVNANISEDQCDISMDSSLLQD